MSQVLNGVVAFVLVRTLTKEEYAWFTIASGMSAVLSSLNDGGIATAVTANGGEVWRERSRLSALIQAAIGMLHRTALVAAIIVAPLMIWLLTEKQAPWQTSAILLLLVVGPQWMATRSIIMASVNRLHTRVRQLQVADLTAAFSRSALTLVPAALGWVNVHVAFLAAAISTVLQAALVKKQVAPLLDTQVDAQDTALFSQRIRRTMKQMYPNYIFNCVQSQLATGLLAILGTASQVADLGALNRLSFFSNFLAAPFGYLIGPGFARCQDPVRLRRLFLTVLGGYTLLLAVFLVLIWWQSDAVLWLFGPKYAHLHAELFLVAVAISIGFVNQVFWTLNFSRGWVRWVWLNIPLTLGSQFTAAFLFDMGCVAGAAKLMIVTAIPAVLLGAWVALSELRRFSSSTSPSS